MYYFITDREGKDWQGRQWGEDVSHTETNDNYYFTCYQSPTVAALMVAANDEYKNHRLWVAEPFGDITNYDYREISTGMKTLREVETPTLTIEQRITFGIVCALNTVEHALFQQWGFNWLKGKDRSKEAAAKMSDILLELMLVAQVAAGHAAVAAVALDNPTLYAACAAHRAFGDSLDGQPLNLNEIATIVTMLSAKEIGVMLSGVDDGPEDRTDQRGETPAPTLQVGGEAGEVHHDHDRTATAGHARICEGNETTVATQS
jgi:hypothetical protein